MGADLGADLGDDLVTPVASLLGSWNQFFLRRPRIVCSAHALILMGAVVFSCVSCGTGNSREKRLDVEGLNPGEVTKITLAAVGDVMLDRGVKAQIARHGPRHPYRGVKDILKKHDIVFFNLECPLSHRGVQRRTDVAFRGDPKHAKFLKSAGFTFASLANNHTLDYGRTALLDTINALESAGIETVGAGPDMETANRLKVIKVRGLKVGFLAYTDVPNAGTTILPDKPSVAGADETEIRVRVKAAAERVDLLVVSFHWGVEYMKSSTRRQRALGRAAIEEGAGLVLGHHPHVLQPVEIYRGRPILYSAGAFIWDSRIRGSDRSAIYVFELSKHSAKLKDTIPVRIIRAQPNPTTGKDLHN